MNNQRTRTEINVQVKSMPSIDELLAALGRVAKMGEHAPLTITYQEYVDRPTEKSLVLKVVTGLSSHPFSEHLKLEALDEQWTSVTVSFKPPGYGDFATISWP